SNSLPPPWQGGALPDELQPHIPFISLLAYRLKARFIISGDVPYVNTFLSFFANLLRVSLNAEETVTVFPALFFYPKAGGRRLKH
ncbi:MAG: hypothetical protein ACLS5Z_05885, partial [Clostridium fessum]